MQRPDGMGADRYNEQQNMRDAAHVGPTFNYDVVAVDPDSGEELYVTDSAYTEEEAESQRDSCMAHRKRHNVEFKVVERDD